MRRLAIFSPSECLETTETYRPAGMSARLVAFAIDCTGNVFCFDEGALQDAPPDNAPVWFFDRDFCKDRQVADSFDDWLALYVKLP